MKKQHEESVFWTYEKPHGHVVPMYSIDGQLRTEHMSAQYLMDQYGMDIGEAYLYVNTVKRCI